MIKLFANPFYLLLATIAVNTAPAVNGGKIDLRNNFTTCTLNGASPSVCTATVSANAKCVATPVGVAALAFGPAVNLASTTLTVTGANGANNIVNISCDR